MGTPPPDPVPPRWHWLYRRFRRYAGGYVRKHFHAVRLSNTSAPLPSGDAPLLVVLNHPSWWDAILCFALLDLFPGYDHFAAIDARAFEKYRVFARIGFFGVDTQSLRGAADFLRTAGAILARPGHAVWVTPQGRFTDVRTRPLGVQPGVGHLAARLDRGFVVPLAVEYPFWAERTPEALVRFGPAIDVREAPGQSGRDWTQRIEEAMTATLDGLNAEATTRDPGRFTTLAEGKVGVGGGYDLWRRLTARLRGEAFHAGHGDSPRGTP